MCSFTSSIMVTGRTICSSTPPKQKRSSSISGGRKRISFHYTSTGMVWRGVDFCFLGVHLEEDLTWAVKTSELLKKAQQILPEGSEEKQHLPETAGVLSSVLHWEHPEILWYSICTVGQRVIKIASPQFNSNEYCAVWTSGHTVAPNILRKYWSCSENSSQLLWWK